MRPRRAHHGAGPLRGGEHAAWIAQVRADVDRAVLISPSFGVLPHLPFVNERVNAAGTWLVSALPHYMASRPRATQGPPHSYRYFASHGVTAMLRQGRAVLKGAKRAKPAADSVLVIVNENDGVNNVLSSVLVRRWRERGADAIATYAFPR